MPPQGPSQDGAMPSSSSSSIRRSGSESDFSANADSPKSYRDYRVRKSSLIGMINWMHVFFTHVPHLMIVGLLILFAQIVHQVVLDLQEQNSDDLFVTLSAVAMAIRELFVRFYQSILESHGWVLFSPQVKTTALVLVVAAWLISMDNPVYLLSFATFQPPDSWKITHDQVIQLMRYKKCFTEESLQFMRKILERSGTGQATAWPPGITRSLTNPDLPSDVSVEGSRQEAEAIIFDVVRQALEKSNVSPKEIDILIINCSLFSPTPSLCAMVVSKFNLRSDVATYNLSGMGCSASLISVDLAKQLLSGHGFFGRRKKALVVSTEILTPNFYHGNERGFLIQNTLFRCGGAAMILSNNRWDGSHRAWYKLLHTVRVQGTGQEAYDAVYETQDEKGERGVRLSKDIVKVAGKTMEKNMTILGPYVLPLTEQIKVVWTILLRFVLKMLGKFLKNNKMNDWAVKLPVVKPYVPDFKRGIDHFCIHAGGRAVIDGIEKNMKLEPFHTEASRMTLMNYGNTSSSSIWYELEYIQSQQKSNPMKKGDRVMQVAFGSGFKCTSGVWLKL